MKFGDVVRYDEFGKIYNAIVLGGRDISGTTPFLNLAYAKEVTDMHGKPQDLSGTGSWAKSIQVRHDVAHASVTTVEIEGKQQPYAGGRWSVAEPEPSPSKKSQNWDAKSK